MLMIDDPWTRKVAAVALGHLPMTPNSTLCSVETSSAGTPRYLPGPFLPYENLTTW